MNAEAAQTREDTMTLSDEELNDLERAFAETSWPWKVGDGPQRLIAELRERRAAEQWPTCSTCVHHHTNSPTCYRGVGRPNKIDERVDQFTFGCNQHASAPPVPASKAAGERP